MNVTETIIQKVIHLPQKAQEEVLDAVEQIEERYQNGKLIVVNNGNNMHPLDLLAEIQIEGPSDLAERHDFYAHGKLED